MPSLGKTSARWLPHFSKDYSGRGIWCRSRQLLVTYVESLLHTAVALARLCHTFEHEVISLYHAMTPGTLISKNTVGVVYAAAPVRSRTG